MQVRNMLFAVLVTLSMLAGVAQAQTTNVCSDPAAYNYGKSDLCIYLPSAPPVPPFSCYGDWNITISSAHLVVAKKLKIFVNDFSVTAILSSYQVNSDGSVFCRGPIIGFPGSNAEMRYNPNNGDARVDIWLPLPLTSVNVQASSRLFMDPSTQSLSGSMDGPVNDYSSNQAYTSSLQGDLEARRPSHNGKGRPMPGG
jgi:hypothetical protein